MTARGAPSAPLTPSIGTMVDPLAGQIADEQPPHSIFEVERERARIGLVVRQPRNHAAVATVGSRARVEVGLERRHPAVGRRAHATILR